MNPVDAIRLMVRHFDGGVEALAVLCGKSPDTLRHEIGGKDTRYKLGLADACTISEACIRANSAHCHAFVNAMAANSGGFIALEVRDTMPGNIHGDAAGLVKECADVSLAIAEAMKDGSMSPNDRKAVERELRELLEQIQKVSADVTAEAERGPALRRV